VLRCEPSWRVLDEVPDLLGPMHYRALRGTDGVAGWEQSKADYAFELKWKRPERATPPRDMLAALDGRYEIKAFELTTENGR
jgi:putative Mg2+ transporter-C (MgtC) family protein